MHDIYDMCMFNVDMHEDEFPSMELIDGTEWQSSRAFWSDDHEIICDEEERLINALLGGATLRGNSIA